MKKELNIEYFIILIVYSVFIILIACQNKVQPEEIKLNEIQLVHCNVDTAHSYMVYLPSNYNSSKKYPVIFCFDPHARGNKPVDSLKYIAEELDYIIIGSNIVRNGLKDVNRAIEILFNEALNNYSIDSKRIYTFGFSGGGRVATSVALQNNMINGAISCGAGFPNIDYKQISHNLNFYGIIGNKDFNYLELIESRNLQNISKHNTYIDIFNGGHSWPPQNTLRDAVLWLEFNAMRNKQIPKNKTLINTFYEKIEDSYNKLLLNESIDEAGLALNKGIFFLKKLKNVKYFEKELVKLEERKEFKEFNRKREVIYQQEKQLRQAYWFAFQEMDLNWWQNEINKLNDAKDTNQEEIKINMYNRLLNYLSMIAYVNINNSLNEPGNQNIEKYFSIYKLVDPENPDYYYYRALYNYNT
ncbi:MAG: hypothetical protein JXB17_05870, partial [Bacteroidales bacterium]|nr:hypothetical protein [Bacteroidales bacterium]